MDESAATSNAEIGAGKALSSPPSPDFAWTRALWSSLPVLALTILLIAPPFSGTVTLYQSSAWLLMLHSVVECLRGRKPAWGRTTRIIVALAGAFTLWSLGSALLGVDPHYSFKRWQSEHLIGFALLLAVLATPRPLSLRPILAAGGLSVLLIALGVWLDPALHAQYPGLRPAAAQNRRVAYLHGFSADITWLTNHLILLQWTGAAAVLGIKRGRPLWWLGLAVLAAALWVVLQTFQVAVFVIVVGLTFVFTIYGLAQWRGRRVWLWLPLWVGVLIAALWARDTFLYPNKKIFHGVGETLSSGASSNAHIQTRLNGIRWAIRKSSERPWFGFGPGRDILRRVDPANFDVPDDGAIDFTKHTPIGHLHNQYADLLVRVGWVGLVLYLAFLATVLIGAAKEKLWRASWTANAGSAWRACAATALAFALVRFCAETYPASSVGIQYWLLIAFAALPASAWTDRWRISESTREPPRSPVLDPPA